MTEPAWSVAAEYGDYPDIQIRDGVAYGLARRDGVHGVDVVTGEDRWFVACPDVPYGPLVTDEIVCFATSKHELICASRSDGRVRWRAAVPAAVFHAPTLVEGTIVTRSHRGAVHAVDAATGERRWSTTRYAAFGLDLQRPIAIGTCVVIPHDGGLVALDARTGEPRIEVAHGRVNRLVADTRALYSYWTGMQIYVHDRATLAVTRTVELDMYCVDTYGQHVLAVDGVLYTRASSDYRVAFVDTSERVPQSRDVEVTATSAPTAHGDDVLVATKPGELVAIERGPRATVRWRRPCPTRGFVAPPRVAGELAIVASEGRVTAVRLPS